MVAARIRKAYPSGYIEPYTYVRGWHPKQSFRKSINLDVISVSDFIKKFGREAFRSVPKSAFVKNGKRKALPHSYIVEAGFRNAG